MKPNLILLFILGFTFQTIAQIKLSPYIGLISSKIKNKGGLHECSYYVFNDKFEYKKLNFGFELSKQLNKSFEIIIDLNFLQGQVEANKNFIGCFSDSRFLELKYKYINLVPKLRYWYTPNFNISIGAYRGINIEATSREVTYGGVRELDMKNIINSKEIGTLIGFGTKKKHFILEVNYLVGFSKIIDNDRRNWLQLKLGYEFILNKTENNGV